MEIIKSKNNETDLLSLASIQFEERLNDLNVFIANKPERVHTQNSYQKHGSLSKLKTKLNVVPKVKLAELYALVRVAVLKNVRVNGMTLQSNF